LFGEKAAEVLPYLAHLLGVRLEDQLAERVQALDGETLKRQSLLSIAQYFTRLAQQQPLVLVFEDLHWADPSSLEALEQLLSATDRVPIMLLLLSRLEREHGSWRIKLKAETDFNHRYIEINLKPLSANEQNQLVDNLLAIADLPETVRKLILERAEGNPFYLEEIVRSLIEQGAIVQDGKSWRASGDILNVKIPDTLQGVLLARIDRLQEDVRRTLQMASVIGRSFLYKLLEAIAEAEQQLDLHLAQLQRVDLVREKNRLPELEYMFKHSLTQEAAYNSLLLERRREFHRKVGEALETLFAGRKEEFLGLLAHHFDAAGDREKAVVYLIRAGDKARLTDEHTEAIGFYQRAVELLANVSDARRLAQVWLKLGLIYHANFQFEQAHQAYESAFDCQRKAPPIFQAAPLRVLRLYNIGTTGSLDPGFSNRGLIYHIFSGLARLEAGWDVVPDVARSWQVLDGGRRYLFHLRDDALWTDGMPVTAQDFEWTWKRNLSPAVGWVYAPFLYGVVGVQDYHEGRNPDPDSLGVCALDPATLEVRLSEPVAYFPFTFTLPITFPLPRRAIESYGEDWSQPEHIITNGPFRLVEVKDGQSITMERNDSYFGEFLGNVQRVEIFLIENPADRLRAYLENRADLAYIPASEIPADLSSEEKFVHKDNSTRYIVFNLACPPLDDLRVRRALVLALDRTKLVEQSQITVVRGGLIPPRLPGHSPDIGLTYDVITAQRLLSEAGFPGGQDFPRLNGWDIGGTYTECIAEIARQWQANLGIVVDFEPILTMGEFDKLRPRRSMWHSGWFADSPDPENFLGAGGIPLDLHDAGWQNAEYDELVKSAARTTDRVRRMAMYRQADRLLVEEQVLVLPTLYPWERDITLVKPWVKNYQITPLGNRLFTKIIITDH